MNFFHTLRGIEVEISVQRFVSAPPNRYADNPDDFLGGTEADYTVTGPDGVEITNLTTDEDRAICQAIKEWLYDDEE